MGELLRLLWAAPEFRGRVVWAYTTLVAASAIGGLTPLVIGWTADTAMRGQWTATLGMVAFNAVWGISHWMRMRADTRGLEGAVTAAVVRYVETADRPVGEVLATVNAMDSLVHMLRFTLPRFIEAGCFAVIGIAGLAYMRWELAALAIGNLLVASYMARSFGDRSRAIGTEVLQARDTLAEAVANKTAPAVLWRCYDLTVRLSDSEANMESTQLAMIDLLKYLAIVLVAYSGGSAGEIMAAVAYIRGVDNLADATINLAGSAGKAKEAASRLQ